MVKDSDDGSVQQGVLPYSLPGSQGWKMGMPFQRLHLGVSFGMTTVDHVTVLQDVVRVLSYQLINSAASLAVRTHGAKQSRGEVELTPFIITLGTSLQELSSPFL